MLIVLYLARLLVVLFALYARVLRYENDLIVSLLAFASATAFQTGSPILLPKPMAFI